MAGPVLPSAFVRELLGATTPERARFTDQILTALGKISPELTPTLFSHPLADFVLDGVASLPALADWLGRAKTDDERVAIVDAMSEIFVRENATASALTAIGKLLGSTQSEAVATTAARALAMARDPGFLDQQHNFLASESPTELRRAALLLGYGRYEPAVPRLLELLREDQLTLWEPIIWALGEIGDAAALPKLHRLLHAHLAVELVIEALGKIGDATSAVRILPVLIEGAQSAREKAAQALARIARANDGALLDPELTRSVLLALERVVDQDDSRLARFHAVVALSWLGGTLDPKRVLAALGGQLGESELDAMSSVLLKKAGAGKSAVAARPSAPAGQPASKTATPARTGVAPAASATKSAAPKAAPAKGRKPV